MSNIKIVTLIGFFTMFIVGVSDLIVVGMLNEMSKEFHVSNSVGNIVCCCFFNSKPSLNKGN